MTRAFYVLWISAASLFNGVRSVTTVGDFNVQWVGWLDFYATFTSVRSPQELIRLQISSDGKTLCRAGVMRRHFVSLRKLWEGQTTISLAPDSSTGDVDSVRDAAKKSEKIVGYWSPLRQCFQDEHAQCWRIEQIATGGNCLSAQEVGSGGPVYSTECDYFAISTTMLF